MQEVNECERFKPMIIQVIICFRYLVLVKGKTGNKFINCSGGEKKYRKTVKVVI